jgi:hypothetical protein
MAELTEQDKKDIVTCIDVAIAECHPSAQFEIRLKDLRKRLVVDKNEKRRF